MVSRTALTCWCHSLANGKIWQSASPCKGFSSESPTCFQAAIWARSWDSASRKGPTGKVDMLFSHMEVWTAFTAAVSYVQLKKAPCSVLLSEPEMQREKAASQESMTFSSNYLNLSTELPAAQTWRHWACCCNPV